MRDSAHFVQRISDLRIESEDILVSFDVVSLFTNVPVMESMNYLSELFSKDIVDLFRECLTTTYFLWNGEYYQQRDGVAMGSPLSPVIANFYMEKFEDCVLATAPKKPSIWLRYVDDTFAVWSHGEKELYTFLEHLNSQNKAIQFTMEKECDGKLAFLDVLVKREDSGLGHTVYRKPTHTDLYLNRNSNHHPSQKFGIIRTLAERAKKICQPSQLQAEFEHLNNAFLANGYSRREIVRALKKTPERGTGEKVKEQVKTRAFLPYIPKVTDRIGKLLKRHGIGTVYKPSRKLQNSLRSAKDTRDPKTSSGVYRIPCSCGSVYIGTTKRSVNTRIKEHQRHCRLGQTEKSAVADHILNNLDHKIAFEDTELLSSNRFYYPRLYREAIEIYKHPNNFNKKEEGLKINKTWYPALQLCTTKKKATEVHMDQSKSGCPIAGQSGSSNAQAPGYIRCTRSGRIVTSLSATRTSTTTTNS